MSHLNMDPILARFKELMSQQSTPKVYDGVNKPYRTGQLRATFYKDTVYLYDETSNLIFDRFWQSLDIAILLSKYMKEDPSYIVVPYGSLEHLYTHVVITYEDSHDGTSKHIIKSFTKQQVEDLMAKDLQWWIQECFSTYKDSEVQNLLNTEKIQCLNDYYHISQKRRDTLQNPGRVTIYCHGELENMFGFDCSTVYLTSHADLLKETLHWYHITGNKCIKWDKENPFIQRMYFNGILPVKAIGCRQACIGFFWVDREGECTYGRKKTFKHWHQTGYICLKSDILGCLQALKHLFLERKDY